MGTLEDFVSEISICDEKGEWELEILSPIEWKIKNMTEDQAFEVFRRFTDFTFAGTGLLKLNLDYHGNQIGLIRRATRGHSNISSMKKK